VKSLARVALLWIALPALAVAPVKFTQTLTQDFVFTTCSYGDLNGTSTLNVQGIAFRDASLNTTRVELHLMATTLITNPLNGKTATGIQNSNETFYVSDGSFVLRGLDQRITIPGTGQVLQIAGRIAVDGSGNVVFSTPKFQGVDLTPLCAALQ
jgi:hypothetical protein